MGRGQGQAAFITQPRVTHQGSYMKTSTEPRGRHMTVSYRKVGDEWQVSQEKEVNALAFGQTGLEEFRSSLDQAAEGLVDVMVEVEKTPTYYDEIDVSLVLRGFRAADEAEIRAIEETEQLRRQR